MCKTGDKDSNIKARGRDISRGLLSRRRSELLQSECISLLCCNEDPTAIITNTSTMLLSQGLKLSQSLAAVRNGPKGPGTPGVGGIERCLNSPERETRKRATESWKRTQKEEGGAEGGMAVFIAVEKAARARAPMPCLIRRPLNLGGQTPRLRLLLQVD
jgi:hypothetical protein